MTVPSRRQLNEKRNKENAPLDPEGRSFPKPSTSGPRAIPTPTKVHTPVDVQRQMFNPDDDNAYYEDPLQRIERRREKQKEIQQAMDQDVPMADAPTARQKPGEEKRSPRKSEDRKSTRLNSSHSGESRMPSSA